MSGLQIFKEFRQFPRLNDYLYTDKPSKKNAQYSWTESHQRAFKELKACLHKPPIFIYPDPSKSY